MTQELNWPGPWDQLTTDADRLAAIRHLIAKNKPPTEGAEGSVSWANYPIPAAWVQWLLANPQALAAESYIVLLTDPDGADWSPWDVQAASPAEAIEKARAAWDAFNEADPEDGPADVVKVYRGTLIERVFPLPPES